MSDKCKQISKNKINELYIWPIYGNGQNTCANFRIKKGADQFTETEGRGFQVLRRKGNWSECLMDVKFLFGMMGNFWQLIVVTGAQHCECINT